jgi:hypothetical protein
MFQTLTCLYLDVLFIFENAQVSFNLKPQNKLSLRVNSFAIFNKNT